MAVSKKLKRVFKREHISLYKSLVIDNGHTDCWDWKGQLKKNHAYINPWLPAKVVSAFYHDMIFHDLNYVITLECNNPRCTNPNHLCIDFQTRDTSTSELIHQISGNNNTAKLSIDDIRYIKYLRIREGMHYKKIAQLYNLTETYIYYIMKNYEFIRV